MAHSLVRKNLAIIAVGGVVGFATQQLLSASSLDATISTIIAIGLSITVQAIGVCLISKWAHSHQLAPVENALENLLQLDLNSNTQVAPLALDQRLLSSYKALKQLQETSAQALLDSKLVSLNLTKFHAILNTVSFGVITFDAFAKVKFTNKALSPMIGQHSENLINLSLKDWCQSEKLYEYIHQTVVQKQRVTRSIVIEHPSRVNRWIRFEIKELLDLDEEMYVVCVDDVTEAETAKHSRIEFVTNLSHELKNPLHTINLIVEDLVATSDTANGDLIEGLNIINEESDRIDRLIKGLLDSNRIESGIQPPERTRVRLPELLNDCVDKTKSQADERDIQITCHIPSSIQAVYLDKSMFDIALTNLLGNAVKYNIEHGEIEVKLTETDNTIEISIRDVGKGIPEKDLPYIFDKFFRASNTEAEGHGVGLSLARDIVHAHHGKLTVDSVENQGSTFSITLYKSAELTHETT